jgi:hypothetical protein
MAIVYIHRRKDIDDPFLSVFYVGIGKTEKRAYQTYNRNNNYWHNIIKKHDYTVEITHNNILWEEACAIEKYLIYFYGRLDKKEGKLCNLTDGGEGTIGVIVSDTTRIKRSENVKGEKNPMYGVHLSGEKNPMYGRKGVLSPCARKIAQYNIETNELIAVFETVTEASISTGIGRRRISDYCNKRRNKRPFKKRLYLWKYL